MLTKVDITKASATNFASDPVLVPHTEILHAPRQHVSQIFTVRIVQVYNVATIDNGDVELLHCCLIKIQGPDVF